MAYELIITSVRKGLDGGSGYQPVLQTRGVGPAVVDRLRLRSGYSHPYPHGNARNPVVVLHRIERISGQTFHVLARICDAGSDHTGRSNFLAHFLTLQDTEARRSPAGPAEAARRYHFKTIWNDSPSEADAPPLPNVDRGPEPCYCWAKAGLDPGIAGDLAEAAASGISTTLIVREGEDVLSLLADALALVPPAKRWSVTFNTCEIEPFEAVWRVIREDLPQAKAVRGTPGVIDLTVVGAKGSDRIYAQFARGQQRALPWQGSSSTNASSPSADPFSATSEMSAPPAFAKTSLPRTTPSGTHAGSRSTAQDRGPPPPVVRKRNLLESEAARERVEARSGDEPRRRTRLIKITAAALFIPLVITALGSVLYFLLSPDGVRSVASAVRHTPDQPQTDPTPPDSAPPSPQAAEEPGAPATTMPEQDEKNQNRRKMQEQRPIDDQKATDEKAKAEQKKQEALDAEQRATAEAVDRRRKAFEAFEQLPQIIPKDLPTRASGDSASRSVEPIVIGLLTPSELTDFKVDIASPRETIGDLPFHAWADHDTSTTDTWIIRTNKQGLEGPAQPMDLATLSTAGGQLTISAANKAITTPQFSLLRQSVLLLQALPPAGEDSSKDAATAKITVKPIQLVRPAHAKSGGDAISFPLVPPNADALPQHRIRIPRPKSLMHFPTQAEIRIRVECQFDKAGDTTKSLTHDVALTGSSSDLGLLLRDKNLVVSLQFMPHPKDSDVSVQAGIKAYHPAKPTLLTESALSASTHEDIGKRCKKTLKPFEARITQLTAARPEDYTDQWEELEKLFTKRENIDQRDDYNKYVRETIHNHPDLLKPPPEKDQPDLHLEWRNQAKDVAKTKDKTRWKALIATPLNDWLKDYTPRYKTILEEQKKDFAPLKTHVGVVITSVTSKAYGEDGQHTVELYSSETPSESDAGPQIVPAGRRSTDLDSPGK